ncbi:MAG: phosphotransferase [Bryobacteraceae bacterium]
MGHIWESRWVRAEPRHALLEERIGGIVQAAFPGSTVAGVQPLAGLRNASYRVDLESPRQRVVVRIFEHDPSLCMKEVDLLRLLSADVPVPEVLFAQPGGTASVPPFVVLRYLEGVTLHDLKRSGDSVALAQAAYATGRCLARIHTIAFPDRGWIGPGLAVTPFDSQDALPPEAGDGFRGLVEAMAPQLAGVRRERFLVHGDFGKRNVLVCGDGQGWAVSGVIDWEFAVAGSPLADIGHLLRYERVLRPALEPHFSNGYVSGGGSLPDGWRRLARVVDAVSLSRSLTRKLPSAIASEIAELIRATVEDRDPAC